MRSNSGLKQRNSPAPLPVAVFLFLFCLCFQVPVILFCLLPLTLLWTCVQKIVLCIVGNKAPRAMDYTLDPMMYSEPAQDIPVRESRPYDIVVFGATGFTGNIICKYLVKTYGLNKSVKWAIAGRSL